MGVHLFRTLLLGVLLLGGLLCLHAVPPSDLPQKCKSGPVDLVFIIDSSRSVRPHEFETMRKLMIDILATLDIGLDATRVGVVQYSSQVLNEFSLKAHNKLEAMTKGINEIIPLAQGTMTGLAIKYAMNVAFTAEEGDRPRVPNVAVIVTDGRPQDRVAEVAAEAREKGIEIYAVGVARADMTSLRAMASPPFEDHVFLFERFDLIHTFGLQFQDKLCGAEDTEASEGPAATREKRGVPNWALTSDDFFGWVEELRKTGGYEQIEDLARTFWAHFPSAGGLGYGTHEDEE